MDDGIFRVSVDHVEDHTVVRAVGEVDVSTAPELKAQLQGVADRQAVIVDLIDVTFIDSSGLSALVGAQKQFKELHDNADFKLAISRPQILKVFEVTGLTDAFSIFDSVASAIK
jgi:anti-sigma B factor antagonist